MRKEKDSMGNMLVPDNAYYGAQTQRAIENFPISNIPISKSMINALGIIKRSAAIVNCQLGILDEERKNAIIQAAYHGVSVKDGVLYTTFAPCLTCTKMIINAGIVEVVYNQDYPLNKTSFHLLQESGVKFRQYEVG